ncbi:MULTISPECIES: hypothetical protein [Oxynema]|nr:MULTISPECIES: hypothetical protein [Oxynema]
MLKPQVHHLPSSKLSHTLDKFIEYAKTFWRFSLYYGEYISKPLW